jgi:pSer/pThr/pTyr-binding forkhead associated (FHA) protein
MGIEIIVTDGMQKQYIKLGLKPLILGRSSKCHITVSDGMISGKHLAVWISNSGKAVIKDLGSTNGTFFNGNKIQESYIHLDDMIQMGKVTISLNPSAMSSDEKGLHTRDFQKTNITFLNMSINSGSGGETILGRLRREKKERADLAKKKSCSDSSLIRTNIVSPKNIEKEPTNIREKLIWKKQEEEEGEREKLKALRKQKTRQSLVDDFTGKLAA